ncbi:MAG: hypothetical protein ACFE8N_06080, partial [Promethearchaeota archaeon]
HIILFLTLMNQEATLQVLIVPLWVLTLTIPILISVLLMILSSLIVFGYNKLIKKDHPPIGQKLREKRSGWSKSKKDSLRKLNHVLIFIGLLVVWYVGLYLVQTYTGSSTGMIPEENNMLLLYLRLLTEPDSIFEVLFLLGWFYYLLFFFFYVLSVFMLINEFTRKSKKLSFPFTFFTKIYLSDKEHENYGTYLFFSIGQMFAAFISPPMIFFAILGISSISDLMASQIGIRFGKKHIGWNKKKTWEGTAAGAITTFIVCFLFVGINWSLIFTIAFLVFDIITNKPINLSDNLLIPIGCSLIYILVRFFFSLDYYTILLFWI